MSEISPILPREKNPEPEPPLEDAVFERILVVLLLAAAAAAVVGSLLGS